VGGLQASLDYDSGGEIAENLGNLYDYMSRRLVVANLRNDGSILDEVASLIVEIKMGWDGIPDTLKN
jgi:flagellar protein FliS